MPLRLTLAHRRRTALALLALLHVGMGLTLVLQPAEPPMPGVAVLHELLPVSLRIALWVGCGAAMAAAALSYRGEHIGWGVAIVMPVERAISYGWSALMWMVPGYPPGAVASLGSAFIWTAVAAIVWLMAQWPEEARPTPRP